MNHVEYESVIRFEESLEIGDAVFIRWTSSGQQYAAAATVEKKNTKSIHTKLDSEVLTEFGSCPAGKSIIVPLILDIRSWTRNNRIEPLAGY